MPHDVDWRRYVNNDGDFELPRYLYLVLNELMKSALDMGTLLSSDQSKLRAFRDQTKGAFKRRWMELAQALEAFDIIAPCGCPLSEYCKRCSGSRYLLSPALSPDRIREIAFVTATERDQETISKLEKGLARALEELRDG